jgi:hypothetical protein
MNHRLAHRVGRSSHATPAAVDKSLQCLTHKNPDISFQNSVVRRTKAGQGAYAGARRWPDTRAIVTPPMSVADAITS